MSTPSTPLVFGDATLPASDRGAAGVALGAAVAGRPVVLQLTDATALVAVADRLREAGRLATSGFPLTLVVRVPVGGVSSLDAAAVGSLIEVPGVRVLCPSTAASAGSLRAWALAAHGVTVLLEDRSFREADGSAAAPSPSKASPALLRDGGHVTLVAWGRGVECALLAAEQLAAEGIEAQVVDLVQLLPVPADALAAQVCRTGRLVVGHDPGDALLAHAVRHAVLDCAFLYLESPLATAATRPDSIVQAARDAVYY